jgi:DNA-binding MarR family transcriptional regulator/N-acetylglutamate synthase-like GNAT family acetyltransferase
VIFAQEGGAQGTPAGQVLGADVSTGILAKMNTVGIGRTLDLIPCAGHAKRRDMNHPDAFVRAIRGFNRFYTKQIGILTEGLLESPFSLTEVRMLFEIANRRAMTAGDIVRELDLDPGYVSRIIKSFESKKLLRRRRAPEDGRQWRLELTDRGRKAFSGLDLRASREIEEMLSRLTDVQATALVASMRRIETILGQADRTSPYVLRPHGPGDVGYVTYRHGVLFRQEFGFSEDFEVHIGTELAAMASRGDTTRERLWIADLEGQRLGSAAIVREKDEMARLVALLVEPPERHKGIGRRLVTECIRYAGQRGYRCLRLEAQSVLREACRLFGSLGFRIVGSRKARRWGKAMDFQTWEIILPGPGAAANGS